MMKWQKGSIAVFLLIVMAVLVPLCGILIDLARFNEAVKIAKSSLKVCTESMLAAYDRQLKEQFGLFAMYPRDVESMEKEIYELLSDNLTPENPDGKITDLYGFKVNRVEVIPIYNLSEPYVLEQQVTEFMKYRAPIQAVTEFIEKLKTMVGLMDEADMVGRNMGIDKLLNEFRADIIHYALLLRDKMKNINVGPSSYTLKADALKSIKENNIEAAKNNKTATEIIPLVNQVIVTYRDKKTVWDQSLSELNTADSSLKSAREQVATIESNIEAKSKELENEELTASQKKTIEDAITAMKTELVASKEVCTSAQTAYDTEKAEHDKCTEEFNKIKDTMISELDKLLTEYNAMAVRMEDSLSRLSVLISHLQLFYEYHLEAVTIAEALIPKFDALQAEKAALEAQMRENKDSGVAGGIGADLEKKMLSIDKSLFNNMIAQLKANKSVLEQWLQSARSCQSSYIKAQDLLKQEKTKLDGFKANPSDGQTEVYVFTGFDSNETHYLTMEDALKNLESYGTMVQKNIYVIPVYSPEPDSIQSEEAEFKTWYYNSFKDVDPAAPPATTTEQTENPELQQTRDNMANAAKGIAHNEETATGGSNHAGSFVDIIFDVTGYPSNMGSKSSEDALARIATEVFKTSQEQIIQSNPFEAETRGTETVNENEKGFFDYELERIRSLLAMIKDLIANGFESLMKSVYMNEYIVSAFKNATFNGQLEYDIGWDRPLESTYFDKAEVEYVIFGNGSEKANIAASQRSIFAIRLVFNLLHVYTDPEKLSKTLSIATAIAGWTIFGVPVVHNFLLIGWAALESYVDSEKLLAGEQVPLIKTAQSWFLDPLRLKDYIVNSALSELKNYCVNQANNAIDDGAAYLEETVRSFVSGEIDKLFAPIEKTYKQAVDLVDKEIDLNIMNSLNLQFVNEGEINNIEDLLALIPQNIEIWLKSIKESLKLESEQLLLQYKQSIKNYICDLIFKSPIYITFKEKVKKLASDVINKGINAASDKLDAILGTPSGRKSGGNNVLGRLIMMDYTDYLRLMLLTVPPEIKALRTADLIQMDMKKTAPENSKPIYEYNTYVYIKAYLDINFWFIPEGLYKGNKPGMIVVEWAQGY